MSGFTPTASPDRHLQSLDRIDAADLDRVDGRAALRQAYLMSHFFPLGDHAMSDIAAVYAWPTNSVSWKKRSSM
jgi:hypothetical protein